MLPPMRHRLILAAVIVLGALCLAPAAGPLVPADGSAGLSLMSGRLNVVLALLVVLLASLPAMAGGVLASAAGNPLAGVFTLAVSLLVLAGLGGPMGPWLRRVDLPGAYGGLIVETLLWAAWLAGFAILAQRLRRPIQARLPQLQESGHLGSPRLMAVPDRQAWAAGLTCAVVSAVLGFFLLRSGDLGQVIGSLLVAFLVGGMLGQMIFPQDNPLPLLLSPLVVAVLAYAYVLLRFDNEPAVLAAWFRETSLGADWRDRLPGLCLVLPIHYASAGVAGTVLGIGLAHGLEHARHQTATA